MKRLFTILLLTIFTLCISSCRGKTTEAKVETEQDNSAKNEEVESGDDTKQKEWLLYYETYENENSVGSMYLIDENGNKKRYLSDAVQELLEKNNLGSAGIDGVQTQYLYINEILYVKFYGYTNHNDNRDGLYAIDLDNGKLVKITDNGDIDYIDYYNDKLYIGFNRSGDKKHTESVFTVSDDLSFVPLEPEHVETLNCTDEYQIVKTPYNESDCGWKAKAGFSLARVFDEVGYVIAERNGTGKDEYIKILPDGITEKIECLSDERRDILYYDKDVVYCTDGFYEKGNVYAVDLNTGSSKLILYNKSYCRQIEGNKLLHSEYTGGDLCVFDLKKEEDEQLYPLKEKTGLSITNVYRCQILNGKVFVCDLKDAELKWFRLDGWDKKEEEFIVVDIDCPIETVGAYKYGTVIKFESDMSCPSCGATILHHSYELFQLNDEYSKHASVINKKLKEKKDDFINVFSEEELACVEHRDECRDIYLSSLGGESAESLIDVDIVNSRFLTLGMEYWWYGGGPHGLSHDDIYMFDLSTAEEISLKNFYPGTESEFKKWFAEKVKEDYRKYPDRYSYESETEAYDVAYESVSFDSSFISYYDDHITLGFGWAGSASADAPAYEIAIPYEELNGHAELTRVK